MKVIIETYKYREFFDADHVEFATHEDCLIIKFNRVGTIIYRNESIKKITIEV